MREQYETEVLRKASTGEIVAVQGVRRSGKSTILLNTIKRLLAKDVPRHNILFVNLEDPRFMNDLDVTLLTMLKETYIEYLNPSGIPYVFLDEIQNIPGFEKWLVKEYELKRIQAFITGSNATLLSREIGTVLSGRYLDVTVFPLSFQEFLSFKNLNIRTKLDVVHHRIEISRAFSEYLLFGGFPRVTLIEDPELKKAELKAYFDSILLRDIVARYRLDNVEALMSLSVYLLSHTANVLSLNALKNHFGLSFDLINRYVAYLENAYLIFRIPLFSWSLKKQQVNSRKVYAIDTGLAHIVSFQVGRKIGSALENLVFLELLRRGRDVYYYKTAGNLEVDFIIKENERITEMIQVSADIEEDRTKKREIRALIKAATELSYADTATLMLLVPDKDEILSVAGKEVRIIDVKAWLLGIE